MSRRSILGSVLALGWSGGPFYSARYSRVCSTDPGATLAVVDSTMPICLELKRIRRMNETSAIAEHVPEERPAQAEIDLALDRITAHAYRETALEECRGLPGPPIAVPTLTRRLIAVMERKLGFATNEW